MIKSMTGYGRGEARVDGKEFLVEMKAVNHRYCDVFIKIYKQVSFLEDRVRELVNKSLSRGKIDVFITFEDFSSDSKNVLLDEELAGTYIKATEILKEKYGLKDDISVSLISRFPDVLRVEKPEADEEKLWSLLKSALDSALSNLINMRENEGKELKRCIEERLDCTEELVEKIKERSPSVVKEYKVKLETRIKDLLEHQTIDDNRLNVEIALFADRCSIDEELVRLGSHIIQTRQALNANQPVGRKLDFLLQEMNREVNTIGSKANDLEIVKNVVELKSELEKIREQIQNIE